MLFRALIANAPCPVAVSQRLEKEGILDNWLEEMFLSSNTGGDRYFAFKRLLKCSDDRSLPVVEKICHSMGF